MIRRPVPADAAGITQVHFGGWLDAYRGIMPDEVLDNLDFEKRRARWHDRIADGGTGLVDADDETGEIRGFAWYGPTRDEDRLGAGEIYAMYVRKPWWGTGLGRGLMAQSVQALREAGYQQLVLWVLRDNARARRFYEKEGWVFDGTEKPSPWGPLESRYELPCE